MKIEDLVIDLKYAKKLKEIGIVENSVYKYGKVIADYKIEKGEYIYSDEYSLINYTETRFGRDKDVCYAFLAEELIKILPVKIFNNDTLAYGMIMSLARDSTKDFIVGYYRHSMKECYVEVRDSKLSNALAKIAITLKERGEI